MSNGAFGRAHNLIRRHRGYVSSDLGLHCLPTTHKMEARLKWGKHHTPGAWDNKSKT